MGGQWDQGRSQKVYGNNWKWTHNNPKHMGHSEGSAEREVYRNTGLPKEDIKFSNKQPNHTPTRTWETTTRQPRAKEGRK